MTITGFWKELGERGGVSAYRVTFAEYVYKFFQKHNRAPIVGIDIFQWMFEMIGFKNSEAELGSISNEEIRTMVTGIAARIRYLMEKGVSFVIVFDGSIKLEKGRNTGYYYKASNNVKFEDKYRHDLSRILSEDYILTLPCVKQLIKMFRAWNIDYVHAPGDAEIELARLNSANVIDAVITNDADALAHGATTVLRKFSRIKDDQNGNFVEDLDLEFMDSDLEESEEDNNGKGKKGPKKRKKEKKPKKKQVLNDAARSNFEYYVTVVDEEVLKKFNLNADKLLFMACVQGDDYSSGVSKLGIKKAWALATEDIGIDPVQLLKSVYVSKDPNMYLRGLMPYNFSERCKMLKALSKEITQKIHQHARVFFKSGLKEAVLDNDFIYASHFYPNYCPYLYLNSPYTANVNDVSGNMHSMALRIPDLPQPLLVNREIKRGNHLGGIFGLSRVEEDGNLIVATERSNSEQSSPIDWFSKPNYDDLMMTMRGTADKEKMIDFLGKAYTSKSLFALTALNLEDSSFSIDRKKVVKLSDETEMPLYRIVFDPRQLFIKYTSLSKERLDEDLKVVDSRLKVWVPMFFFEICDSGKQMMDNYERNRSTPKTTPKNTPRKKKTPNSQKTTLDLLASSSKSPIKILTRKNTLLEIGAAEMVNGSKRVSDESNLDGSPKKKKRVETCLVDVPHKSNPVLIEPFEEDAEISRIMDSSDYVGSSFGDDDFANFFKMSMANNPVSNNNKKENGTDANVRRIPDLFGESLSSQFENKNTQTLSRSNIFPQRREIEHSANKITRGISLMDQQTRLPSVPQGPTLDEVKTLSQSQTKDNLADDTFSTNGTTEMLFADELERLKESESGNSQPNEGTAKRKSEDFNSTNSLSDHGTLDLLFADEKKIGSVNENIQSNNDPKSYDNSLSDHGTADEIFADQVDMDLPMKKPEDAIMIEDSLSDHGTVNFLFDDDKTPTKPKLENSFLNKSGEEHLTTNANTEAELIILDSDDDSVKEFVSQLGNEPENEDILASVQSAVTSQNLEKETLSVPIQDVKNEPQLSQVLKEDNCSLPSDFEGDSIMLAQNTDDEEMWIIPPPQDTQKEPQNDSQIVYDLEQETETYAPRSYLPFSGGVPAPSMVVDQVDNPFYPMFTRYRDDAEAPGEEEMGTGTPHASSEGCCIM